MKIIQICNYLQYRYKNGAIDIEIYEKVIILGLKYG